MLLVKKRPNKPKSNKAQELSKDKKQFLKVKSIMADMVFGLKLEMLKKKVE